MQSRSLLVFIGLLALLTLGVGASSALLLPKSQSQNGNGISNSLYTAVPRTYFPQKTQPPHITQAPHPSTTRTSPVISPTSLSVAAIPNTATTPPAKLPAQPTTLTPSLVPATAPAKIAAPTLAPTIKPAQKAIPTKQPVAVPTQPPPTAPPVATPNPERIGGPVQAPNNHSGPRWVTLQVGHWHNERVPDEQSHLAAHTGASAAGVNEVDVNLAVAQKAAPLLIERGYKVDILDATVPVSYTTDLFLALHADGSPSSSTRGFKAVAPWNSVPASDIFVGFLYEEYGKATRLPSDPITSVAMANYYAFNPYRYRHAVTPDVPSALLEMGFVTNPTDRKVLSSEQERIAWGIANAVDRYFRSGAAGNTPTPYPTFTPTRTSTSTPTNTSTPTYTPTYTPTETPTPLPTELAEGATQTAVLVTPVVPTTTPKLPKPTSTPLPTVTPLQGITTSDGRWLPPLASNRSGLPVPGTDAPPVLLDEAVEDSRITANGREQEQVWRELYIPYLGRSVWQKGVLRQARP